MHKTILKFIGDFRKQSKDLVSVFTEGYCFYFAVMLTARFPEAIIIYDNIMDHFYVKIGRRHYDITGEIQPSDKAVVWDQFTSDPLHRERIIRDVIHKL